MNVDALQNISNFIQVALTFVIANKIEIAGVITGLVVVLLQYKASYWFAVVGSISSALYIYIFYKSKFYADAAMSVYYLAANIYALLVWIYLKKSNDNKDYGGITHISRLEAIILFLVFLTSTFIIRFVLKEWTDSPVATGDAITTGMSIIAMWLLARKNIEHWLVWTTLNAIATGLYIWKQLYPTAFLYGVYIVISILGYFKWKKEMLKMEKYEPTS